MDRTGLKYKIRVSGYDQPQLIYWLIILLMIAGAAPFIFLIELLTEYPIDTQLVLITLIFTLGIPSLVFGSLRWSVEISIDAVKFTRTLLGIPYFSRMSHYDHVEEQAVGIHFKQKNSSNGLLFVFEEGFEEEGLVICQDGQPVCFMGGKAFAFRLMEKVKKAIATYPILLPKY